MLQRRDDQRRRATGSFRQHRRLQRARQSRHGVQPVTPLALVRHARHPPRDRPSIRYPARLRQRNASVASALPATPNGLRMPELGDWAMMGTSRSQWEPAHA
jgi:hypothetical protein